MNILDQDVYWVDADGYSHDVDSMTPEYAGAVLRYLWAYRLDVRMQWEISIALSLIDAAPEAAEEVLREILGWDNTASSYREWFDDLPLVVALKQRVPSFSWPTGFTDQELEALFRKKAQRQTMGYGRRTDEAEPERIDYAAP